MPLLLTVGQERHWSDWMLLLLIMGEEGHLSLQHPLEQLATSVQLVVPWTVATMADFHFPPAWGHHLDFGGKTT